MSAGSSQLRDEFEAKYQRSADDPASAEMLAIWEAAWNAATERAAKKEREECAKLCDSISDGAAFVGDSRAERTADGCAAAIRSREGKGGAG